MQSHEPIPKNMLLYQVQLGEMPESDSVIVEQLHLTTWPDHGVPSSTSNLLGTESYIRDRYSLNIFS